MKVIKNITIDYKNIGLKIEKYILKEFKVYNYIYIQKLIRTGQIRINKKRIKLGYSLKNGDILRIPLLSNKIINNIKELNTSNKEVVSKLTNKEKLIVENINKNILYQNEHFLAIDKPKGLAVQGGKGIKTSVDKLLKYIKTDFSKEEKEQNINNDEYKLKIVHRLDKETSGVLLLAKTNAGAKLLFNQFKDKTITKIYYCLVQGNLLEGGIINQKLLKLNTEANKSVINNVTGKEAITEYEVISRSGEKYKTIRNDKSTISLLRVKPRTGRNHQIRAHLGIFLKTPIVGDAKYGYITMSLPFNLKKNEMFLHAYSINLKDINNNQITITACLDNRWLNTLNILSLKDLI